MTYQTCGLFCGQVGSFVAETPAVSAKRVIVAIFIKGEDKNPAMCCRSLPIHS